MKTSKTALTVAVLATAFLAPQLRAEDAQPNEAELMAKMAELGQPNENHQQLAQLAGNWTDEVKMWMVPGMPPLVSTGTCTRKPIMNGRFYEGEFKSVMSMPGPDGKMQSMPFTGASLEGYDNAKKKFISTWADSMGTGIMMSEGTYDPATKTFTYTAEMQMLPGMTRKVREVLKVIDKDHHTFEFYEDRGGKEMKTMEIAYTRAK